jgi:hypothetical protein
MAADPDGGGWIIANTGAIYNYGDVTAPPASAPTVPVLGSSRFGTYGLDQMCPTAVALDNLPTVEATGIVWQSWGGATATGTGTGTGMGCDWLTRSLPIPSCTELPIGVVAHSLGTCGGGPPYTAFSWYFPIPGQTFVLNPAGVNVCFSRARRARSLGSRWPVVAVVATVLVTATRRPLVRAVLAPDAL